jgi:hypothetical protein
MHSTPQPLLLLLLLLLGWEWRLLQDSIIPRLQ